MKKLYLGTNTKMYKNIAQTVSYLQRLHELTADISREDLELFVIPSFTTLQSARASVPESSITLGAQNMGWEDEGQFTGEISPLMLEEVGTKIVELGHSERRHVLMETNEMIRLKTECALRHDFTCLLCIGETGPEKAAGTADEILQIQLKTALQNITPEQSRRLWVAYEPVWAIGVNGTPASADYVEARHASMRQTLAGLFGEEYARDIPLLYGGSVNPQNAIPLISLRNVDGLFIGRSAWDADRFNGIIRDVLAHTR